MIFKAISKTGSLGSCFVCMGIGSSERLAMQILQVPDAAETRTLPKLFPPHFSDKNRLTSSRPDAVRIGCSHLSVKTKKQQTSNEGGWLFEVAGGN
jgi:hypothetical protein